MKASDSHSRIMGMDFFYSLPVPEFREWVFSIPFPFPDFGIGIIQYPFPFPFPNSQKSFPLTPDAIYVCRIKQRCKLGQNSSYKEALGDPILQEELPEEKKKPPYSYASLIRLAIINSESQKVFLHFLNPTRFLLKIGSNGQLYCHQLQSS